jgi:hypothetical protein
MFDLGRMFRGRLGLVDRIGEPDGLAFAQRVAEARQFGAGEEPLASAFLIPGYAPRRIGVAAGNKPAVDAPCIKLGYDR